MVETSITGVNAFGRILVKLPIRTQNTKGDRKIDARGTSGNTIRKGMAISYSKNRGIIWRRSEREKTIGAAKKSSQLQVLRETELFLGRILGLSGVSGEDTIEEMKVPPNEVRWVSVSVPGNGQKQETAAPIVPVASAPQQGCQALERVYPLEEGRGCSAVS